jgi:hypothetical protein
VVISSNAGKDEKSKARSKNKDTNRIIKEIVIFAANNTSRRAVGRGRTSVAIIPIKATGINTCLSSGLINLFTTAACAIF